MRTDSLNLSPKFTSEAAAWIRKFGQEYYSVLKYLKIKVKMRKKLTRQLDQQK